MKIFNLERWRVDGRPSGEESKAATTTFASKIKVLEETEPVFEDRRNKFFCGICPPPSPRPRPDEHSAIFLLVPSFKLIIQKGENLVHLTSL